jgi:outer membrane protein OmpA-like peptidoglycan-associated protein
MVPEIRDKYGVRVGNIRLEPRFYLAEAREITEPEFTEALSRRLSDDSLRWQHRFLEPAGASEQSELKLHPHVLQKGEELVEIELSGREAFASLASEIFVEFPPSAAGEPYSGWQFLAQKNGQAHGRISGDGWCRVLELEPEEQELRLRRHTRNHLPLSGAGQSGCLGAVLPAGLGCNPLSWFGSGSGCLGSGCGQTGCGLLALLALLALLFSLLRSCTDQTVQQNPLVIRDTVYVKEGMQVKEFVDSTLISKTDAILLPNVQFYTNSARLLPYSIRPIQELAAYLESHPQVDAVIKGHTDDVGEDEANLQLSQARAEAVRAVLISIGISPDRIKAFGYGESRPKVRGQSVEARALNRRVEVELVNTETVETRRSEKPEQKQ